MNIYKKLLEELIHDKLNTIINDKLDSIINDKLNNIISKLNDTIKSKQKDIDDTNNVCSITTLEANSNNEQTVEDIWKT